MCGAERRSGLDFEASIAPYVSCCMLEIGQQALPGSACLGKDVEEQVVEAK